MRPEAAVHPRSGAGDCRSGLRLGVVAGTIGLGCCVYPVVLVLLGASSAASAISLGRYLYGTWGWAFRAAGVAFAVAALAIQRRRARSCPADRRVVVRRTAARLLDSGLATYGILYLVTTGLGNIAT